MTGPGRLTSVAANPDVGPAAWLRSASRLAERALLGALLVRPQRLDQLAGWVGAADFADASHRAVFTAISQLHTEGRLPPPSAPTRQDPVHAIAATVLAVRGALRGGESADHSPGYAALPGELAGYGAALGELAEANGSGQASYLRHARIVAETSARRQLARWGLRLEQAATAPQTADGALAALHATREAMMGELASLIRQVQGGGHVAQVLQGSHQSTTAGTVADRTPVPDIAPAVLPPKLVERAERHLIHVAIADPRWRAAGLLQRLRPDDFAAPAHVTTWQAIQAVAGRGEPVDPVTVAWEAETYAHTTPTAILDATDLATMTTAPSGNTTRMIATVARASLTRHAQRAREDITHAAADRSRPVQDVLIAGRASAEQLQHRAARLGGHNRDHATTPARASRVTRLLDGERDPATITPPTPGHAPPWAR